MGAPTPRMRSPTDQDTIAAHDVSRMLKNGLYILLIANVGQFIATFLTKLSFVKVSVGYNIALMMIGAFAVVLPYSLIYNVFLKLLKKQEKKVRNNFV